MPAVPPVTAWPAPWEWRDPARQRIRAWCASNDRKVPHPLWAVALGYLLLPAAVPLLLAAVALVGCLLTRERWTVRTGWFAGWKCGLYATTFAATGIWLDRTGNPRLAGLLLLAALQLLLSRPTPAGKPGPLDSRILAPALVHLGLLKATPDGKPPRVLFIGGPLPCPTGHKRKVNLGATTVGEVMKQRVKLAGLLGLPERGLVITHDPNDSPTVMTMWADRAVRRTEPIASPLATATGADWREPVRIGTDQLGEPVHLTLFEQGVMVGGRMGYGKTNTVRLLLAPFLLDPTTTLYGLDGKGAVKDYGGVAPLARRWVWGTDPDPVPAVLDMLREILAEVQRRNSSHDEPEHGWPGIVLLLEEYQDVRAAATPEQLVELDELLGRIVRMWRAVGGVPIVSTQRPSVNDLPSGVRNLLSLAVCLNVRPDDARIVLGSTPDLPIPSRRGEAIVGTPAGQVLVDVDSMDLPAWKALCARAAELRTLREPVNLVKQQPARTPEAPLDPFGGTVRRLLADGPLTATALWDAMPVLLRPGNLTAFGLALGKLDGVERKRQGEGRVWQLNPSVNLSVNLSGTSIGPVRNPSPGGFQAPIRAQEVSP